VLSTALRKDTPMPASSTTVLDSLLFRNAFGTDAMRRVFSDKSLIARYAEVEIALARVEARCGVIPTDAARAIAERTDVASFDLEALRHETDIVGYPILPLVHQMARQCGEAGRYVHWGATTQDIMDTAVVLQMRAGLAIDLAVDVRPSCRTSARAEAACAGRPVRRRCRHAGLARRQGF
jgi:3-carboxy-cis,cis-muconate cycloisomerase